MTTRLTTEIRLLYKCEAEFKMPAAPVICQLVQHEAAPLPDLIPTMPEWVSFTWPDDGAVNCESE